MPDPQHLRRSRRYPGALDIEPAAAIGAALDLRGLIARDPGSVTGEMVRMIGQAVEGGRVLVVVPIPERHPPDGHWHVATAWPANRRQRELYAVDDDRAQEHEDDQQEHRYRRETRC